MIDFNQQRGYFQPGHGWANRSLALVLRAIAWNFNWRPALRASLIGHHGPLQFTLAWTTEDGSVAQTLRLADGRMQIQGGPDPTADCRWIFRDQQSLKRVFTRPPSEVLLALLRSEMRIEGNLSVASAVNYLLSELLQPWQEPAATSDPYAAAATGQLGRSLRQAQLRTAPADAVAVLADPCLSRFRLQDFPRLETFLQAHFTTRPSLCPERALALTRWHRTHGFEHDRHGQPWIPELRQARAYAAMMQQKQPRLRPRDLLAGTTTAKDVGVVLYPDAHGTLIWGELLTAGQRKLNPYQIDAHDADLLHKQVFPYWLRRNFREWVREHHQQPTGQAIEERFAAYFNWKTVALSHTIPDFPSLLRLGTSGLRQRIQARRPIDTEPPALQAMRITLDAVESYANNLASEVRRQAAACHDLTRKAELQGMAEVCAQVPREPARSLHEALQAMWTLWVALHMENTNAGLSLGRMDQYLQPYFLADWRACDSESEREAYLHHAIELCACFFLRCTDHLPLVPDIGNYLFGGSSSDQAVTLGGIDATGGSAVNDMSYILLKVTELLRLRDPNVNARYHHERNSRGYLKRLCEVNLITCATPSIHGDKNVIAALRSAGYPASEAADWSAVGCVEPTLSGRHMGHTGCLMFNLVAALELTLHDGMHPLMRSRIGRRTGLPQDFEAFYCAFVSQLRGLAEHAITYNNQLAEAHRYLRPTPLLSSLLEGCIESGQDATAGGARFNSSGVACIGLSDIVDSLLVVERLVYGEQRLDLRELRRILDADFAGAEDLLAYIRDQVPKFGSGDPAALAMARRVTHDVHTLFASRRNYRGGPYWAGFWSMSNHVAFGTLSGALPSGRRAGKAFTPGLTPSPAASPNLLDNMLDVAQLPPADLVNNVAFNVKYVPAPEDSPAHSTEQMSAYVQTYCEQGGMQLQLNVVSSEMLRDARAHPDRYRDLLVRISGYNAYFVTLNPDMQQELIERAEFCG